MKHVKFKVEGLNVARLLFNTSPVVENMHSTGTLDADLVIASKNWTLNTTAAARKKSDGGVTGQSTTSTPRKFDAVSRRNSTAPGSTTHQQ